MISIPQVDIIAFYNKMKLFQHHRLFYNRVICTFSQEEFDKYNKKFIS